MKSMYTSELDATAFTLYRQAAHLASAALELRAAAEQLLRAVGDDRLADASQAAAAVLGSPPALPAELQPHETVATRSDHQPAKTRSAGQVGTTLRPAKTRTAHRQSGQDLAADFNRQMDELARCRS